jgi:hypothetical protein
MRTFESTGIAGLFLKYSGNLLDAAVSLDADILAPPSKYYMRYTAGATGLVPGVTLIGGTSTAVMQVQGVIITAGSLAGSDAEGVIFLTVTSGTFQTGENLNTAAPATLAIARSALLTLPREYTYGVKSIIIQCETAALRVLYDGSDPTTSTETGDANFGYILNPFDSYSIKGWANCERFKMINAVAASNGVANVGIFYGGVE